MHSDTVGLTRERTGSAIPSLSGTALLLGLMVLAGCAPAEGPKAAPASPVTAQPVTAQPVTAQPESTAETFGIRNAVFAEPDLLAAGQPTRDQLEDLAKAGYRTVIDLRTPGEDRGFDEVEHAATVGLTYVNLPVSGDSLDGALFELFGATLDAAERPVLLHCGSANRVGALYAGWLAARGGDPEQAIERGREVGMTSKALEERVRAFTESLTAPPPGR